MEPLPIHLHDKITTNGKSKPHIIYRRAVNLDERQELDSAREKREIHTCGTEGNTLFLQQSFLFKRFRFKRLSVFSFRHWHLPKFTLTPEIPQEVNYRHSNSWITMHFFKYCLQKFFFFCTDDPKIRLTRSLNETQTAQRHGPAGPGEEKYIETLVVVDPKMTNFHGEDAAKQYALSACNIVSIKYNSKPDTVQYNSIVFNKLMKILSDSSQVFHIWSTPILANSCTRHFACCTHFWTWSQ